MELEVALSRSYQARSRPGAARGGVAEGDSPGVSGGIGNAGLAELALGSGQQLPYLEELEAAFGVSLGHVVAHLGQGDALAPYGANALASGDEVVFGEDTPLLRTVAHEVAHVLQDEGQAAGGGITRPGHATEQEAERAADKVVAGQEPGPLEASGGGVHAETLADTRPRDRKSIEVSTAGVSLDQDLVDGYFEKMGEGRWGVSVSAPGGAKVVLGGIDSAYLTPMTSLAATLSDRESELEGVSHPVFAPNMTVTVKLNLKKHGLADGSYRFTWTGAKRDGTGGTVIVESLAVGAPVENEDVVVDSGASSITGAGVTFALKGSWDRRSLRPLCEALKIVPAPALARLEGMDFRRGGAPTGVEAGHYDPEKNEIVMFDNAFEATSLASGTSSNAARLIAHEIGHAIDLQPLYAPLGGEETAPDSAYKEGLSESGTKWKLRGGTWQIDQRATHKDNDFRKAALADGLSVSRRGELEHGVTEYGETDWQELYAESFSIYVTDPAELALLRPKVSAYFAKKFPREG
jgi:hypothetical protein